MVLQLDLHSLTECILWYVCSNIKLLISNWIFGYPSDIGSSYDMSLSV